jgi:hypothetical protein
MEGTNDNDTWTRISLAALRVLTQIEEVKEKMTREHQETAHEKDDANQDAQHDARDAVLIEDKKRSA